MWAAVLKQVQTTKLTWVLSSYMYSIIINPLRMRSKGYSTLFVCVYLCYHPSGNSFCSLTQTKVS